MAHDDGPIVALDPTSGPLTRRDARALAARPESLDGHVIGLVANGLGRGEPFLDALLEELARHADFNGVIRVLKSSVSVPPEPADWSQLTSEATVAVAGFGG